MRTTQRAQVDGRQRFLGHQVDHGDRVVRAAAVVRHVGELAVGRGAEGFDVAPNGKELWAANAQDGTISIVDMEARKVTQTLDASVNGANRLKLTPDGKMVFVSTLGGSDLSIFDAATRKAVKRVNIGHGAAGILMRPEGSRAYVACTPDSYVAVVDLKTLEVTDHIDAGKQPDGLAWLAVR